MEHEAKRAAKPVDWDELYPGRFLKAGLLKGKQVTLTITDVDREELAGDDGVKKVKGFVSFKESQMQLVLNKTNGICLREMFGRKLSEWNGKRVTIFASTWNGEPCIRIWGSPDISANKDIEVQLPRRKPIRMTLHAVAGKGGKAAPAPVPEREPGDDGDEPPLADPSDYEGRA